jgi:hypothetical protein
MSIQEYIEQFLSLKTWIGMQEEEEQTKLGMNWAKVPNPR